MLDLIARLVGHASDPPAAVRIASNVDVRKARDVVARDDGQDRIERGFGVNGLGSDLEQTLDEGHGLSPARGYESQRRRQTAEHGGLAWIDRHRPLEQRDRVGNDVGLERGDGASERPPDFPRREFSDPSKVRIPLGAVRSQATGEKQRRDIIGTCRLSHATSGACVEQRSLGRAQCHRLEQPHRSGTILVYERRICLRDHRPHLGRRLLRKATSSHHQRHEYRQHRE